MKNRWLIAASAVGIHISIGWVYAWSVVSKPLMKEFNLSLTEVSITFSIAIFVLGMSAAFFGHFVEKRGPRISGTISAILFGIGILGSGLVIKLAPAYKDAVLNIAGVNLKFIYLIYITYGILGGAGLGTGYIAPVSTLIKWFPDKRGLATGLAIMGFGFSAFLGGMIMQKLIANFGIANMFFILGSVAFILMSLSSLYLAPPPAGWSPAGFHADLKSGKKKVTADLAQLTANQAVKTARFYFLWVMFCINITCGIALLSVASPLAQEVTGITPMAAAAVVSFIGLFNGLGRLGWSALSDHIGRPAVWVSFFVIEIAAYFLLPSVSNLIIFQSILFLIITCYGGAFASMPAYICDVFGTKQVSAILGYMLTAWAVAGIIGPLLISIVRDATGSYTKTMYIFGCLFVVALTISFLMIADIRRLRQHNKNSALTGQTAV